MAGSSQLVKELREKTGAGILDCQKALTENSNDIEKAIDYLRQKGLGRGAQKIRPRNQPRPRPRLYPHGRKDRCADRGQL